MYTVRASDNYKLFTVNIAKVDFNVEKYVEKENRLELIDIL